MIITFGGEDYTIPDTLEDITLEEYMDWNAYKGMELWQRRDYVDGITDETLKGMELRILVVQRMQYAVSHFSTIPLQDVIDGITLEDLATYYLTSALRDAVEFAAVAVEESYDFDSGEWEVYTPSTSVSDSVVHDEFTSTVLLGEYLRQIVQGDWTNAAILCAAYFRQAAENFSKALIDPLGVRVTLIKTLPLNMAFATVQHNATVYQEYSDVLIEHWDDAFPAP